MRGWWAGVVLAGALLAACDQVLSGVTLGGAGKPYSNPSARSSTDGGDADGSQRTTCTSLAVQYEAAVSQAQRCTPASAADQCARTVPTHLSPCESCLSFVNDPTQALLIADQWLLAGCDQLTGSNCTQDVCPYPTNNVCLDMGDGTGRCSSAPRIADQPDPVTGDCTVLLMRYAAAVGATQYCTPGAPDQCAKSVPSTLNPCLQGCVSYLNDTTLVEVIVAEWKSLGCGNPDDASLCSDNAHTCPAAVPKTCMLYDNGVAICASAPPAP